MTAGSSTNTNTYKHSSRYQVIDLTILVCTSVEICTFRLPAAINVPLSDKCPVLTGTYRISDILAYYRFINSSAKDSFDCQTCIVLKEFQNKIKVFLYIGKVGRSRSFCFVQIFSNVSRGWTTFR